MSNDHKNFGCPLAEDSTFAESPTYQRSLHALIASSDAILLDVTTALHPGFESLLSDLILILQQYRKRFTLLPGVIPHLLQLASCPEEQSAAKALRVLEILRILQNHGIIFVWDHAGWDDCYDGNILRWISENACERNVLLLTQSPSLAADCALLCALRSCRMRDITVRHISGPHGQLDGFCSGMPVKS